MVSNMAYVKLDSNYTASKSIATRVLNLIESCEGFTGDETVIFVGDISRSRYFRGTQNSEKHYLNILNGLGVADKSAVNSFTYNGVFYVFLKNVMGSNLTLGLYSPELYVKEENNEINDMPLFPAYGSVKKIQNTIVVKMQPVEE